MVGFGLECKMVGKLHGDLSLNFFISKMKILIYLTCRAIIWFKRYNKLFIGNIGKWLRAWTLEARLLKFQSELYYLLTT